MKINKTLILIVVVLTIADAFAQQKTALKLKDAIALAISKSNEAVLANTKIITKKLEFEALKNNQLPNLKISGQYQRLTGAEVNLKLKTATPANGSTPAAAPKVEQLILGQVNASMPVFSGFKIQNNIKASKNLVQAQEALSKNTQEEIAINVVELYADLYKAQKSVILLDENLKRANQRVKDFLALEQNGIIARNDLLKAQLQVSKVQLNLDEAQKNITVINFYLINLMKLPAETEIFVDENEFRNFEMNQIPDNEQVAFANRNDLKAVGFQQKASENYIKIAKAGYYPNLNLVAGYTTLDLQNVITVQNAMNFGVGISYDLSSIFKNGKEVKLAKNRSKELQENLEILKENIKIDVERASEDYKLALKQDVVYKQAVEQTTENYRIIKDKYDNGLADTNDLLDADVEQLNAKINQAYTKANIIEKYYQLLGKSGQLIQSFN